MGVGSIFLFTIIPGKESEYVQYISQKDKAAEQHFFIARNYEIDMTLFTMLTFYSCVPFGFEFLELANFKCYLSSLRQISKPSAIHKEKWYKSIFFGNQPFVDFKTLSFCKQGTGRTVCLIPAVRDVLQYETHSARQFSSSPKQEGSN